MPSAGGNKMKLLFVTGSLSSEGNDICSRPTRRKLRQRCCGGYRGVCTSLALSVVVPYKTFEDGMGEPLANRTKEGRKGQQRLREILEIGGHHQC